QRLFPVGGCVRGSQMIRQKTHQTLLPLRHFVPAYLRQGGRQQHGGRSMAIDEFWDGHNWLQRVVRVRDQTFLHRRCTICHRDLATSVETGRWQAVHVGIFQFDFLDAQTTERWISEECPGQPLPTEANELRMYPNA